MTVTTTVKHGSSRSVSATVNVSLLFIQNGVRPRVSFQHGREAGVTKHIIARASLDDLRKMKDSGELRSSAPVEATEDLGPDFWARAELREPVSPKSVHLKLDPEVFTFFKSQGKGHITRMQDVLKAYVKAHQQGR
jgi:uncharacterized protein (DUF4415 family)